MLVASREDHLIVRIKELDSILRGSLKVHPDEHSSTGAQAGDLALHNVNRRDEVDVGSPSTAASDSLQSACDKAVLEDA